MRNLRNNELHFALGPAFTTWKVGYECWIFKLFSPFSKVQNKRTFTIQSTLRAKRATYTFRVDKSSLKMPKMVHFGEFLKTWRLWSNSVTRHVTFNRTKIGGKCQNTKTWNATFLVIFKHCGVRKCVEPTKESAFATNRKFQHPKNKLSDTFYSTFVI